MYLSRLSRVSSASKVSQVLVYINSTPTDMLCTIHTRHAHAGVSASMMFTFVMFRTHSCLFAPNFANCSELHFMFFCQHGTTLSVNHAKVTVQLNKAFCITAGLDCCSTRGKHSCVKLELSTSVGYGLSCSTCGRPQT